MTTKITEKELLFLWSTINDLEEFVDDMISAGGEGLEDYKKRSVRARKLIQRKRRQVK